MTTETHRCTDKAELPWFALLVKPRHEKSVARALDGKGYQQFLPLYKARQRWSDRVKESWFPLFPCYAFCRFQTENRLPILQIPGVRKIIGFGKTPAPIADHEISAIQAIVKSELPAKPWMLRKLGDTVQVKTGPLAGVEGSLIHFKGADRLVVSVNLLQRSVAVEIDREWVV